MISNKQNFEKSNISIDEFIIKQKELLEIEHEEEKVQHNQLFSTITIPVLESMGVILTKLMISNVKTGLFGKILLTLTPTNYNKKELQNNKSLLEKFNEKFSHHKFSPGDTIGLYEMPNKNNSNTEMADLTKKPLIQGLVYQLKQHKIIIAIEDQPEINDFTEKTYILAIMTNDVTYKRYLNALDNLHNKDKGGNEAKSHSSFLMDVLFGKVQPQSINPYLKKIDKIQIDLKDSEVNQEQKQAIEKCIEAQSIYLVHGPPGTGKTKTVCEYIVQCVKYKMKILACAASNIAVDNMTERLVARGIKCCRIGHPARLLPSVIESSLDNMVYKDEYSKNLRDSKRELKDLLKKILKAKDKQSRLDLKRLFNQSKKELKWLEKTAVMNALSNAQVILATNTGAADKQLKQFVETLPGGSFDVIVIDECAQALEVSCWIPLTLGKKAILAGDHYQLPPTIKSKAAEEKGLNVTLFDRLMKDIGDDCSQILRVQYRMNKLIMEWSSKEVYNGKLLADESVANYSLADLRKKKQSISDDLDVPIMTLVDTAGCGMPENTEDNMGDRQSKYNIGEADIITVLVKELFQLYGSCLKNEDIGIITPYNAQVQVIRKLLDKHELIGSDIKDGGKIEVSTVDGFQGREKEVILISMVRSNILKNIGFLSEYRRMNVAVTRAKRYVGIVCDTQTVKQDKFLKKLIEYIEKNGEVRSASEFLNNDEVRFNYEGGGKEQLTLDDSTKLKNNTIKEISKKVEENKKGEKNKRKNKKKGKNENQNISEDINPQKNENQIKDSHDVSSNSMTQEEMLNNYFMMIDNFMNDENQNLLELPPNLNSYERMKIHEYAEKLKVDHESVGIDDQRHIVLKKHFKEKQKNKDIQPKQSDSDQLIPIEPSSKDQDGQAPSMNPSNQATNKKVQNTNKKDNEAQISQSKKNKKNKVKKEEDNLDDDAFLDALIAQNNKCYFQVNNEPCKGNIQILGIICKYCNQKFCTKHSLPEIHGCGDAAHIDARNQFKNQFNITYGQNVLTPITKGDENAIRKKLADKINKNIEDRGIKKKKGKQLGYFSR